MKPQPLNIMHIVGARPNYMKIAPIMAEMVLRPQLFRQTCVHTGQHYDANMSEIFFHDLGMPQPDIYLKVGSGTHAEQTARIMLAFEPLVLQERPDWVIVVGDVNSTIACALVCAKLGIPVAHVEAGLRSFDRSMPEEINRLLTDQIADLLFTPSKDGDANLLREGIPAQKIHFVGNVMIDTLVRMLPKIEANPTPARLGLKEREYVLVTLHRPVNVDDPQRLQAIMGALVRIAKDLPVVFPVHPRTRKQLAEIGFDEANFAGEKAGLRLLEPLGYLDFLALMRSARLALTDSGGIQEETTFLGVPCLTARPNTERPVTVEVGTNRLIDSTPEAILSAVEQALNVPDVQKGRIPDFWDGKAAQRIVEVFAQLAAR
jgi:UDP-N-acetylglucosamine 2-epimerase (non-hydrolysing)